METDLALPDGRTLHVYDTGSGTRPVFWHHGTPNIGTPPAPLFPASDPLGIRWLSYDRPGYGGSSPRPGRDIASAAGDVLAIADALGIDRFAVVGHSGGGAHALACGALLPDRVRSVLSISGLAPYGADGLDWFAGMSPAGAASLRAAVAGRAAKEQHEATATEDDPGFIQADLDALSGEWSWFMSVVGPAHPRRHRLRPRRHDRVPLGAHQRRLAGRGQGPLRLPHHQRPLLRAELQRQGRGPDPGQPGRRPDLTRPPHHRDEAPSPPAPGERSLSVFPVAMTEVLLIGGRSGAGKTSVAVELHSLLAARSVRHALIEGDTLDLAWPWPPDLAYENLAAIWSNYASRGYSRLIYTNTNSVLDSEPLLAARRRCPRGRRPPHRHGRDRPLPTGPARDRHRPGRARRPAATRPPPGWPPLPPGSPASPPTTSRSPPWPAPSPLLPPGSRPGEWPAPTPCRRCSGPSRGSGPGRPSRSGRPRP